MTVWIALSIVFYAAMVWIWVKGMDIVSRYKPENKVQFYFVMSAIRFIMALTIVALYMLFNHHSHQEAVTFCLLFSLMYVLMVIITIILKH